MACEQLCAAGFTNVFNVAGGTAGCVEAGLPVVRGKNAVSLERQVRMAAGRIGADWRTAGLFGPSVLVHFVGGDRGRIGVRRHYRHVRHGDVVGEDALESCALGTFRRGKWQIGIVLLQISCGLHDQSREAQHENRHCRRRGRRCFGGGAGSAVVGRRRNCDVRTRARRFVRQLRPALLHRRRNCRSQQAFSRDARSGCTSDIGWMCARGPRWKPSIGRTNG